MTVLRMSERDRAEALQRVCDCRLSVTDAGVAMNVTWRHATRLLAAYRSNSAAGLMSKRRGRPSNRRHSDAFRGYVIALIGAHYPDFEPTLAS